jgi:hypothetical protein
MTRASIGLLLSLVCGACSSGYAGQVKVAYAALDRNQTEKAIGVFNKQLGVKSEKDSPSDFGHSTVLLLLDRGMVLQQTQQYGLSSRDLEISDKRIEILDFSQKGIDKLGRYLYSDDTGPYRAPAYEKLMINTVNMLNYLARNDLSGARVEARRFAVMEDYITHHEDPAVTMLPIARYIAGYVNEASGRPSETGLYYKKASENPVLASLVPQGLSENGTYKPSAACEPPAACGTLLISIGYGRVPAKQAKRVPIGAAIALAGAMISPISAKAAAQGAVTWVIYPELAPRRPYPDPLVAVNGAPVTRWAGYALDAEVYRAWKKAQPAIVASAITRALTRFAAGQITQAAAGGGSLGALVGIATQAGLAAADTPDTRSWGTLPARLALVRQSLPAGTHTVQVNYPGGSEQRTVTVKESGYTTVVFGALR